MNLNWFCFDAAHKVRVNHLFGIHVADVASHAGTAVGIMKVACMDATCPDMVCPHTSQMIMNGMKPENTTALLQPSMPPNP